MSTPLGGVLKLANIAHTQTHIQLFLSIDFVSLQENAFCSNSSGFLHLFMPNPNDSYQSLEEIGVQSHKSGWIVAKKVLFLSWNGCSNVLLRETRIRNLCSFKGNVRVAIRFTLPPGLRFKETACPYRMLWSLHCCDSWSPRGKRLLPRFKTGLFLQQLERQKPANTAPFVLRA